MKILANIVRFHRLVRDRKIIIFCFSLVYVPMNARNGERQMKITFANNFANVVDNKMPIWNVTVNQLDCLSGQPKQISEDRLDSSEKSEKNARNSKLTSSEWLAPPGCLQYFIVSAGRIESFNFNSFQGKTFILDFNRQLYSNFFFFLLNFFFKTTRTIHRQHELRHLFPSKSAKFFLEVRKLFVYSFKFT